MQSFAYSSFLKFMIKFCVCVLFVWMKIKVLFYLHVLPSINLTVETHIQQGDGKTVDVEFIVN